jgi:hypothetical protein
MVYQSRVPCLFLYKYWFYCHMISFSISCKITHTHTHTHIYIIMFFFLQFCDVVHMEIMHIKFRQNWLLDSAKGKKKKTFLYIFGYLLGPCIEMLGDFCSKKQWISNQKVEKICNIAKFGTKRKGWYNGIFYVNVWGFERFPKDLYLYSFQYYCN